MKKYATNYQAVNSVKKYIFAYIQSNLIAWIDKGKNKKDTNYEIQAVENN